MKGLRTFQVVSFALLLTDCSLGHAVCDDCKEHEALVIDCAHRVQEIQERLAQLDRLIAKGSFYSFGRQPLQDRTYLEHDLALALHELSRAKAALEKCSLQKS